MSGRTFDDWASGVVGALVSEVEAGPEGSWSMPWHRCGGDILNPRNATTEAAYHGINVMQLLTTALHEGFESGRWATYKQWEGVGAQVRRGTHGTACVRWVTLQPKEEAKPADGEMTHPSRLVPSFFTLFAREQVDNAPELIVNPLSETERVAQVETLLTSVGAVVHHGGDRAFYSPGSDSITLPSFEAFRSGLDYYSTAAHEHTHWTGHTSRLARDLSGRFGDAAYALEELTAEMGAALVMAHVGLTSTPRPDHAQYVASWLKAIQDQPKALVAAAKGASDAVLYLLKRAGVTSEEVAA